MEVHKIMSKCLCAYFIFLLFGSQSYIIHEVLCVHVENGSWYKKYMNIRHLSSYSFLPSTFVAANLIKHYELERIVLICMWFLLVSKLTGEYMSHRFYLL